jgi:hypothetical protein
MLNRMPCTGREDSEIPVALLQTHVVATATIISPLPWTSALLPLQVAISFMDRNMIMPPLSGCHLIIEWGGNRNKIVDKPHYQIISGNSISELRNRFECGEPIEAYA